MARPLHVAQRCAGGLDEETACTDGGCRADLCILHGADEPCNLVAAERRDVRGTVARTGVEEGTCEEDGASAAIPPHLWVPLAAHAFQRRCIHQREEDHYHSTFLIAMRPQFVVTVRSCIYVCVCDAWNGKLLRARPPSLSSFFEEFPFFQKNKGGENHRTDQQCLGEKA